jgi:hypothetical protein
VAQLSGMTRRVEKALIKFVKNKRTEMSAAIIQDIANKVGLIETFKIAKEFFNTYTEEKSAIMFAEDYVYQRIGEAVLSYLEIYNRLTEEFKDIAHVKLLDIIRSNCKIHILSLCFIS